MQKEVAHGTPRAAPPQPKSQARRREGCEDIAKKTFADLGLLCVFALWLARTDAFRKLVPRTSHYRGEPCSKNTLLNYSNTKYTKVRGRKPNGSSERCSPSGEMRSRVFSPRIHVI